MPKKDDSIEAPAWIDPDDAPVWTKAVFDRAEVRHGDAVVRSATGTLTKRGRPKLESPKLRVTLRVDGDVLAKFRESGPGWQGRMNEALRKAVMA